MSEEVVRNFPPVLLHADRDEPLSEDSQHMAELCKRAGVPVELELYDGTAHVFQMLPHRFPQATSDSLAKIGAFVDKVWGAPQTLPSVPLTEDELMKMSNGDLRQIMDSRNLSRKGCLEKRDLVERILGS